MHRLLKRQISKVTDESIIKNEQFISFTKAINEAYNNFDQDHRRLELILELSSKESFRELTNFKNAINSATAVAITDHKGRIQFVNENFEKISGYTLKELFGADHNILKSGYHSNEFFKELWETIALGNVWKGEILNKAKDGHLFWMDSTIVPLLNDSGIPNQYITIRKDITKEKNAEIAIREYAKDLEKKNKELDQFAYIVSHDLKAPLRAINNLSEWIAEDIGEHIDEDIKNNLILLRGRVLRMEAMINGILEFSRVGRAKNRIEEINIYQLVEEIFHSFAVPSTFKIEIQKNLPSIVSERVLLEQVFSNLISNAIKYNNNENPYISINFTENEHKYEFCVKDNGIGIESEFFEKIFVIFQTLQPRDKFESTGVGLAIVKKIMDEKGEKIWLESELKKGTTFYFTWSKNK